MDSSTSRQRYRFREFLRALLPNAAWSGIQWLVHLIEATLVAAAFATYQWFLANLSVVAVLASFLVALLVLGLTPIGGLLFWRFGERLAWRCARRIAPSAEYADYLSSFLARNRSPMWDPHLEDDSVIDRARLRIADVPFELHSSPLEQSIAFDHIGRTQDVTVAQLVERLLSNTIYRVSQPRGPQTPTQVFLFLGAPASGKSSLMIQMVRWLARQASSDGRYPIPVYVNLTHFGDRYAIGAEGLSRLVRTSIRQACPRYLSNSSRAGSPIGEDSARLLSDAKSPERLLYVFDGLDEVPGEEHHDGRHQKRIEALAEFIEARPRHLFLVTCREEDYVALRSYRNSFTVGVYAIQPWSRRLFNAYIDARAAVLKRDRRAIRRLVKSANDADTWGPLRNSPFLAAMFLAWPTERGVPTAAALWQHFVHIRLQRWVASDAAYLDAIQWLDKVGMFLTVNPDKLLNKVEPWIVEAAQRAGLLADTLDETSTPEFAIKPLQHYFAARYMLAEIQERTTADFALAHQRLQYATRLLIELGKDDAALLTYLSDYLTNAPDVHAAARRFERFARSLTSTQLDASDELEDAMITTIERVIAEGDGGDFYLVIEGIKCIPSLLSKTRDRAALLLNGLVELGTGPVRRRVFQLYCRSPRLLFANAQPFARFVFGALNAGTLGRDLSDALASLPTSTGGRATSGLSRVIRWTGRTLTATYLYSLYLLAIWAATYGVTLTAYLFSVPWPYDTRVVLVPQDVWDGATRLAFFGLTVVLPWIVVRRAAMLGFRNVTLPSRVITVLVAAVFIRYLVLLPVLGVFVIRTVPSGLEFGVVSILVVAPLASIMLSAWVGPSLAYARVASVRAVPRKPPASDAFDGSDVPEAPDVAEDPHLARLEGYETGQTRSPTVAWYSMLLAMAESARAALRSKSTRVALALTAAFIAASLSLLWMYRLAWFAAFLLLITLVGVYLEMTRFRYDRECKRMLASLRVKLASSMREDFESTLSILLDRVCAPSIPLAVRQKYLQFIASDVPWNRELIERLRHSLTLGSVPSDIRSYVEILIATKTREVEMREQPNIEIVELERMFRGVHNDVAGGAGEEERT